MSFKLTFDHSAVNFIVESFGYEFVNGHLVAPNGDQMSCKFCKRYITYGKFGGILGAARPLITEFVCKDTECLMEVAKGT